MPKVIINTTDQEHDLIKSAAQADSRSINSWCKLTLLGAMQGTKTVTSTIHKGEDLIAHKRDNSGKFTKRV
jgi:hypothetical protein